MKISPILVLLSLGLSSLAQGIPSPSQNPRDLRADSVVQRGFKDGEWTPTEPPATNDIIFKWCGDYNMTMTCSQERLKHGWCYELGVLDPILKNQLEDVGTSAGKCMLFRNSDCKGEHTAMFVGEHLYTPFLCQKTRTKWHLQATSVRCCAGSPAAPWCDKKLRSPDGCVNQP
ncbi:hypothetical protein J3F84DRAFT_360268 [Trichoderma pleuroticola]